MNEEGELKDVTITWIEDPTKACEYAQGQTNGMRYVIKRKRTKEKDFGQACQKERVIRPIIVVYHIPLMFVAIERRLLASPAAITITITKSSIPKVSIWPV